MRDTSTAPATHWRERLHASGLRATSRRLAVLDALDAHPHISADALHAHVGPERLTRQAVYLNLHELVESGLVRRITGDGPALYETRSGDNHHHLICDGCGSIVDIDCSVDLAPCLDLPASLGMDVRVAEITFRGLCAICAAGDSASASSVEPAHSGEPAHSARPAHSAGPESSLSQPPARSKESL